ncbi:MAG: isoleucine--tRNA ligase [Parvularculales bacterium]
MATSSGTNSDKSHSSGESDGDYRDTLFLPRTDFPMKAGLTRREPELLARWQAMGLHQKMRKATKGRDKYILHDGPPYANGNLHLGHALNKILKDSVVRSRQMMGYDAVYVPGWDCHGLPIEWKIEEQYRAQGKNKDDAPVLDFRAECRAFAEHWIEVQKEEFQRLGIEGEWENPYTTMSADAEGRIICELHRFIANGLLYRGSQPVMWSVVEKTALAEAEVEYHDYVSDTIWVKFPLVVDGGSGLAENSLRSSAIIWTTTPWTIPGNRAIAFSDTMDYGLYAIKSLSSDSKAQAEVGEQVVVAMSRADILAETADVELSLVRKVESFELAQCRCAHPLREAGLGGYDFDVPLLAAAHVTDDTGTGFVHTAPGHGREDFELWMASGALLDSWGVSRTIPATVDAEGCFTKDAPGFEGMCIFTAEGEKGDANKNVTIALHEAGCLLARGRLRHQYPHSWRSKKPIIFRNTPQWFIAMDKPFSPQPDMPAKTLREYALEAIEATAFTPETGRARLLAMVKSRPDWVISRQRSWGVPIAVFVHRETAQVLAHEGVNQRIAEAFKQEGADVWFKPDVRARFLGGLDDVNPDEWEQVIDILDVWFESGCTHNFVLEHRPDLAWPANLYLEGSDQHRGWFQSSLLESCATRGHAPYDGVLTHGFFVDEEGRKMSKSQGDALAPQKIIDQHGADILRLWVVNADYSEDMRISQKIVKSNVDAYRKIRNCFRFLLGNLADFDGTHTMSVSGMPSLERWVLHRLAELDQSVRGNYKYFDFKRVIQAVFNFITLDLSSFYFDIRKDALYCDEMSAPHRQACQIVLNEVFHCLTAWLAPLLCFTAEEVWLARFPDDKGSVHLRKFPDIPADWFDKSNTLVEQWHRVRTVRRVVTNALEIERREKRIGSSLEAAPEIYVSDVQDAEAIAGLDMAEICITSSVSLKRASPPANAFRLEEDDTMAVVPLKASGEKCARCWKYLTDVGDNKSHPDLCGRCIGVVSSDNG